MLTLQLLNEMDASAVAVVLLSVANYVVKMKHSSNQARVTTKTGGNTEMRKAAALANDGGGGGDGRSTAAQ